MIQRLRRHLAPLALLLPALALLHARELAGGRPYFRDVHQLLVPVRRYAAETLRNGEFPHWWPFDGAGSPLAAQPMFAVFHPVQLLYLALPFWNALALENLLASLALATGTYALALALRLPRRAAVFAALAMVTSGVSVSMLEFGFQRLATAAMPWYAFFLLRATREESPALRPVAAAAFVLASALVVEPQFGAFAALFGATVTFAAGTRRRWVAAAAPALGGLLAAVSLLPAALLAPHTTRAGSLAEAERWVMTLPKLAALALPFDLGRDELYVTVFVGPVVVALAGVALVKARGSRVVVALAVFAALALWAGAGSAGGLGALLRYVPVWSGFRYPEKWLVPATLALSLLGAEGLRLVAARWSPRVVLVAAALLGTLPLARNLGELRFTDDAFYAPGPMVELLRREGVSLTGAAFERSNTMAAEPEQWAAMRAAGAGGGGTAFNGLFGLPTLAPALPGASGRLTALYAHVDAMASRLDGVFGVGVMVLKPEQIEPRLAGQVLGREDRFGWTAIRLKRFLPRAWATPRGRRAGSAEEARAMLVDPAFRPGREVVLEGAWDEAWGERAESPAVSVEVTARANASVTLAAELPWDGFVVLNEAWFPGWTARVDANEAPVLVANGCMRAVPVPAGRHEIAFAYRTPGLVVGAIVSVLAMLAMLALVVVGGLRARRVGDAW